MSWIYNIGQCAKVAETPLPKALGKGDSLMKL